MKIQLRGAVEDDVRVILDIINYEIQNTTVVYDETARSLEEQLDWFRKKEEENMPVIVAEKDGNVVGYGTYGIFRPRYGYRYSVEHSIYVSNGFRGDGIGKLLMRELIQLATKQGHHVMIAGIDGENYESYNFHKKFGFVEVGRLKEVGRKFDKWLDLVFMQLALNEEQV